MRKKNTFTKLDPRDPNYDDRYDEITDEDWEEAAEYEAECKLEDMENNERWGIV